MSANEKEMAFILAHEDRSDRFQAIVSLIKPKASSILDIGCGIGSLASLLAERFPLASIVGIDRSKYLLCELQKKNMKPNILILQGDVPTLPLRQESFDLVVAVQVLHEVLYFKGKRELVATLNGVYGLLRRGGQFIVLDHRNPGNDTLLARLSKELIEKLRYFELKFKPRKISYEILDKEWVRMSMRDFYDFVTKIWAMNTDLEEEEMNETHTPFTEKEFADLCNGAGFKVIHAASLTPIDSYLEHYKIDVKADSRLPERHFIVRAEK